jgi:hypothetical protein
MKRAEHVGRTQHGSHIIMTCACRPGGQSLSRPRDKHRRHKHIGIRIMRCSSNSGRERRPANRAQASTLRARDHVSAPGHCAPDHFRRRRPFSDACGAKSFSGANKLSILSWRPGGAELGAARANRAPTLRAAYRCRSGAPRCRLASITMCYMIVCVKSEGRCSFIRGFSYGGVVRCARPLPMRSNLPANLKRARAATRPAESRPSTVN